MVALLHDFSHRAAIVQHFPFTQPKYCDEGVGHASSQLYIFAIIFLTFDCI
jgi:hypothetical protein